MKERMSQSEREIRNRFEFSRAVRGKYHDRYLKGSNVTLLAGDPELDDDPLALGPQDAQLVEIAGKHLLISHLVAAGFEVAEPIRDKGIDLIVYRTDSDFVARPIQMKASSTESFSLDARYENVPNLLIAYVWNVQSPDRNDVYAMTFNDAKGILHKKGFDKTTSWRVGKYYFVREAGAELKQLLSPFRMNAKKWKQKLQRVA
jgi:hypothetical protein